MKNLLREMSLAIGIGCALLGRAQTAQPLRPSAPRRAPTLADVRNFTELTLHQVQAGEAWEVVKGRYVELHFVAGKSSGPSLSALFDRAVKADCEVLKIEPPSKPIPVYVFPSLHDLTSAIGVNQPFSGGISLGNWGAVIAPKSGSAGEWEAGASHVMGQALLHDATGLYGCALFAEGAAFYLQGRFRHSNWISAPVPLEPTSLTVLADKAQSEADYLQGARFISYLVKLDRGNPQRFKQVLSGLNRERIDQIRQVGSGTWAQRVDRVFRAVYGKGLDALEVDWRLSSGKAV